MEASQPLSIDSACVTALSHLPSTFVSEGVFAPLRRSRGLQISSQVLHDLFCHVIITSHLVSSIDVLFLGFIRSSSCIQESFVDA